MAGIIATIIAACKGKTTLAWICGIWTVIGIVMALSGSTMAVTPGWLFVVIAIGSKNERKKAKNEKSNASKASADSVIPVDSYTYADDAAGEAQVPALDFPEVSENEFKPEESSYAVNADEVCCSGCGAKLSRCSRFCPYCGQAVKSI